MIVHYRKMALKFAKESLILATLWLVTLSIVGANWSDRPMQGSANLFGFLPLPLETQAPPLVDDFSVPNPISLARYNGAAVNVPNPASISETGSFNLEFHEPGASYIRISP